MNNIIDLRSDTVTLPSDEMRKTIASSKLGDDVFGEDPCVNKLEQKAALIMGKEGGLLELAQGVRTKAEDRKMGASIVLE